MRFGKRDLVMDSVDDFYKCGHERQKHGVLWRSHRDFYGPSICDLVLCECEEFKLDNLRYIEQCYVVKEVQNEARSD